MGFCRTEERRVLSQEIRGVKASALRVPTRSKKEHERNIGKTKTKQRVKE
ncbi:MAG: hypothetical protein ACI8ZM_000226 [Crocinitomix sp.]|jgi:hypothetical protein